MVQIPFLGDLLKKPIDKIKEYMNHPQYSDIISEANPFFSDRGEFEEWRNDMLQNKQPWGMVPLAEAYNEEWGQHLPTTWDNPEAEPFPMYTTPERAGLEGLFAENPELNYQNPSSQMFPWQPNYPAIYAADRYMNEKIGPPPGWTEEDLEKQPGLPFDRAVGVWDASDWFREQKETEGPGKDWGGVNFPGQGIALDVEGTALYTPDPESFYNELYRNIVPHEFGHELEKDPEMWKILPYPQTSGWNPGEGKHEKVDPGDVFLHDILYNMGPQYSKTHPYAGTNTVNFHHTYGNWPGGHPGREDIETQRWGQDFAALPKEQAMNYAALQNFSRRALNEEPHSYKSNQSWNMESNRNVNSTSSRAQPFNIHEQKRKVRGRGPSRAQQRLNTGGIASLRRY